jgi:hypothetical protein
MREVNFQPIPSFKEVEVVEQTESSFILGLPEELIVGIFEALNAIHLPEPRVVCKLFKIIADDRTLLKNEIKAILDTIRKLTVTRPNGDAIEKEINDILAQTDPMNLKLYGLLAIIKREIQNLSPSTIATFLTNNELMVKAPLFQRYYKKVMRDYWKEVLKKELELRHRYFLLNLNFEPDNFVHYLDAMQTINKSPRIELDFSVNLLQASLISRAFEEGKLRSSEVVINGNHEVNQEMLAIYLNGIALSKHVDSLRINNCTLYSERSFTFIEESLRANKSLVSLSLNDFAFSNGCIEVISQMLESHPHITNLTLRGCSCDEIEGLLSKINRTHIVELDIINSDIKKRTIDYLLDQLSNLGKVQVVNLENNRMSNEDIDSLLQALLHRIETLKIVLPEKKIDWGILRL